VISADEKELAREMAAAAAEGDEAPVAAAASAA
jgi:hypothetical protein